MDARAVPDFTPAGTIYLSKNEWIIDAIRALARPSP
jgi:hypothetical protein